MDPPLRSHLKLSSLEEKAEILGVCDVENFPNEIND